ncbi:MAG: ATP-binding protein [Silicimonas sp.]|nr:ATP-binding protein [Silicimonas sp.]
MVTTAVRRNRLGKRMVSWMILAAAILSLVAALLQLQSRQMRAGSVPGLPAIEDSALRELERALAAQDTSRVTLLLNNLFARNDIAALRLATPENTWRLGPSDTPSIAFHEIGLTFAAPSGHGDHLAHLRVGLPHTPPRQGLRGEFGLLLAINFAVSLVAAGVMLVLFDRLAARHMRRIIAQTDRNWLTDTEKMTLDRPNRIGQDELDDIVAALNTARASARKAHGDLERQLEETTELNIWLADAGREQTEFTFAISHDLKSPSNTIHMLARDLREELGDTPSAEALGLLDDIDSTSARMIHLVEDILAYSRTIGEALDIEEVDLKAEVDAILRDLSGDISRTGAKITMGDLPVIQGNRMQIRMLMQNLISNGIKFRDPTRKTRVEITGDDVPADGRIRISVRDNGIGIPKEHFDKIFGLFKRLHARTAYQGSGIGLAVCQRIVSNHGGRIEVASIPGEGSTFTAILPKDASGPRP